jgi:hypothetical protein
LLARLAQTLCRCHRQIVPRDLPFETRGEQRLLPRPRDGPVVSRAAELTLAGCIGKHRIGHEQTGIGQEPCGKRAQHAVDEVLKFRRGRILQQQRESTVGMHHRNRLVLRIERNRIHDDIAAGKRGKCRRRTHAEIGGIGGDLAAGLRIGELHAK